jgi:hypothetical protein
MFDQCAEELPIVGALIEEDCFESPWLDDANASWVGARQVVLLAEFARRRPGDHPLATRCDIPLRLSEYAPDELGIALRLSRTTATNRLTMAQTYRPDPHPPPDDDPPPF